MARNIPDDTVLLCSCVRQVRMTKGSILAAHQHSIHHIIYINSLISIQIQNSQTLSLSSHQGPTLNNKKNTNRDPNI